MKLPLCETIIKNITFNILFTLSLNTVVLLIWPMGLLTGCYCIDINPPIAAWRAQWVVSRRHHTICYINIFKFGQIRGQEILDLIILDNNFTYSTARVFASVVYPSSILCLYLAGHWCSLLSVEINSVLVFQDKMDLFPVTAAIFRFWKRATGARAFAPLFEYDSLRLPDKISWLIKT